MVGSVVSKSSPPIDLVSTSWISLITSDQGLAKGTWLSDAQHSLQIDLRYTEYLRLKLVDQHTTLTTICAMKFLYNNIIILFPTKYFLWYISGDNSTTSLIKLTNSPASYPFNIWSAPPSHAGKLHSRWNLQFSLLSEVMAQMSEKWVEMSETAWRCAVGRSRIFERRFPWLTTHHTELTHLPKFTVAD